MCTLAVNAANSEQDILHGTCERVSNAMTMKSTRQLANLSRTNYIVSRQNERNRRH